MQHCHLSEIPSPLSILLVRSKSQILPMLKEEGPHSGLNYRKYGQSGPSQRMFVPENNYEIKNYSDYRVDEVPEFFVCIKPKINEFKEIIENLMVVNKDIKVVVFVPMTCFYRDRKRQP